MVMKTMLDPHRVIEYLGHRREAVGGAGCVRDDEVIPGQLVMVDAVDERQIRPRCRRGDDHALGARFQMRRRLVAGSEDAGAFKCDIDAELLVRQFGRIAHRRHLDRAGADIDGVAIDLDFALVAAMHRIIAQEMRIGLDRAEIVDGDDLDIRASALGNGAQDVARRCARSR